MNTGKVLISVLAGAAAGALAGILFAPHKGKITRKKISRNGEAFAKGAKEKFNEYIDDITQKFEKVKEDADEFVEQSMNSAEEAKRQAKMAKG
jgi:gas vesicle protein